MMMTTMKMKDDERTSETSQEKQSPVYHPPLIFFPAEFNREIDS